MNRCRQLNDKLNCDALNNYLIQIYDAGERRNDHDGSKEMATTVLRSLRGLQDNRTKTAEK